MELNERSESEDSDSEDSDSEFGDEESDDDGLEESEDEVFEEEEAEQSEDKVEKNRWDSDSNSDQATLSLRSKINVLTHLTLLGRSFPFLYYYFR